MLLAFRLLCSSRVASATARPRPLFTTARTMSGSESDAAPARKKAKTNGGAATPSSRPKRAATKSAPVESDDGDGDGDDEPKPKRSAPRKPAAPKAPRKKKAAAADDDAPLPPRAQSAWKIGAHVSAAGGVEHAVLNAAKIGAGAFALFLKSQRKWASPALRPASVAAFKDAMRAHGYDAAHVLPHGSYLLNLGNPDAAKREQSYVCFLDDLRRAEMLGLKLYNFHPGSTVGACAREESVAFIAQMLNRAHKETKEVVTVLENMAGQGNVLGNRFEDLQDIIALVEDKSRVGVCLDTCHMFAAGYDLRTKDAYEKTMGEFDALVGARYLKGMHLNDSKGELGCKKDRHENIGLGKLGLRAFAHVVRDARARGVPLVLETPNEDDPGVWRVEVAVLAELAGDAGAVVDGASGVVEADGGPVAASTDHGLAVEVTDERLAELVARVRAAAAKASSAKPAKKKAPAKRKQGKKDEDEEDEGEDNE